MKKLWFCADDITRCVHGTVRESIIDRPQPPAVWPMKIGTNLTQQEVLALECAGFRLVDREDVPPIDLQQPHFVNNRRPVGRNQPASARDWPTKREGKVVRRRPANAPHLGRMESARTMTAHVTGSRDIPNPGCGHVYSVGTLGSANDGHVYEVTISNFPACNCPDFTTMIGAKKRKYVPCKHLYYIFLKRMNLAPGVEDFIHQQTLSHTEIQRLLWHDIDGPPHIRIRI